MNSAYRSRLRLTSSSRRTWRVVVFGCLDGAFSSDNCFAPFFFRCAVRLALQAVCSDLCTRTKHGTAHFGAGGSDPVVGGCKPPTTGSLPPFLVFCPRADVTRCIYVSALLSRTCDWAGLDLGTEAVPEVRRTS